MQGNFSFHNPTRLHFGKESLAKLSEELQNYGPKVMLTYGGGSIKKNGIYDQVTVALRQRILRTMRMLVLSTRAVTWC